MTDERPSSQVSLFSASVLVFLKYWAELPRQDVLPWYICILLMLVTSGSARSGGFHSSSTFTLVCRPVGPAGSNNDNNSKDIILKKNDNNDQNLTLGFHSDHTMLLLLLPFR